MKKYLIAFLTLCGFMGSHVAWAQTEESPWFAKMQTMDSSQVTLLIILVTILGIIILLLFLMIYLMSFITSILKKENPELVNEPSWWEGFKERFVTGKMDPVGQEEHKMLADHSYDGITELDNFMPPWLQYGFIVTVIIAAAYYVNFTILGTGPTQLEEYNEELRIEALAAVERSANEKAGIDENSVVFDESSEALAAGKVLFEGNCAACHAQDGGGGVGPNLTDEYWIHGGSISDVFKIVKYGVVEKGMVPWEDQLSPEQIQQVSSYVLTFKGKSAANPKEPQGELYTGDSASESPSVTDSTAVVSSAV